MRSRPANRAGLVGAVNAKSFFVEPDPARAQRIFRARSDDLVRVVVSGFGQAVDNLEFAGWTGRRAFAYGHGINLYNFVVFDERQLAVREADDDLALRHAITGGVFLRRSRYPRH